MVFLGAAVVVVVAAVPRFAMMDLVMEIASSSFSAKWSATPDILSLDGVPSESGYC